MSFLNTLANLAQEGSEAFLRYQPVIEEKRRAEEERQRRLKAEEQTKVDAQWDFMLALAKGDPQRAYQIFGDRFLQVAKSRTGGLEIPTREVTERRLVPGQPAQPEISVGAPPPGMQGLEAPRPGQQLPQQVIQTAQPAVPERIEETPTGQRELALPGEAQELQIDVPGLGRMPVSQAKDLLGPEGLRNLLKIFDPIAAERLELDRFKTQADYRERLQKFYREKMEAGLLNPGTVNLAKLRSQIEQDGFSWAAIYGQAQQAVAKTAADIPTTVVINGKKYTVSQSQAAQLAAQERQRAIERGEQEARAITVPELGGQKLTPSEYISWLNYRQRVAEFRTEQAKPPKEDRLTPAQRGQLWQEAHQRARDEVLGVAGSLERLEPPTEEQLAAIDKRAQRYFGEAVDRAMQAAPQEQVSGQAGGGARLGPNAKLTTPGQQALAKILSGAIITSATRTPADNQRVGGVQGSRHLTGDAVDVVPVNAANPMAWIPLKRLLDDLVKIGAISVLHKSDHFHVVILRPELLKRPPARTSGQAAPSPVVIPPVNR